jgi:DNA-binding response OmpR family regulator
MADLMRARILVVEDNPLNLIADVLEFEGFDAMTARS